MPAPVRCGTPAAYQRHRDLGQAACTACCDAHQHELANRRQQYRRHPDRPHNPIQYRAALTGREPAEALAGADRDLLIRTLVTWGWTDRRIAELTRQTEHTTARIRGRLGLPANHLTERSAA